MATRPRVSTSTSNFGVGRRESHDASGFYGRFSPPTLSSDNTVLQPTPLHEPFVCGDSTSMSTIADGSVALIVTSPPYFAGKQYEEELERDGVPASYVEYLDMLRSVFTECVRTLEPGGRIAVNVANLGRKPYRSLSADVIAILQDDLGLLLRGEIVWQKGEGATGSCAWGSFRSPTNPVFRDITERVIIASKGRFDRARSAKQRQAEGLPWKSDILTEDFMSLTLDVWSIPPESAKRVGHPAPFPVELPEQLIRLYTYENDLVLDPFMGSGSTLAAAARLNRRYVGYDLDPAYVAIARERVGAILQPEQPESADPTPTTNGDTNDANAKLDEFVHRSMTEGRAAKKIALELLAHCGFSGLTTDKRIPRTGVTVDLAATDPTGRVWYFDVCGSFTTHRGGMLRTDAVWKALGRAAVIRSHRERNQARHVLLTTNRPRPSSDNDTALRAAGPRAFFDLIDMLTSADLARLASYATHPDARPVVGWWTARDLTELD